eukprot:351882-Chlamydomonas_euryale.AAC.8
MQAAVPWSSQPGVQRLAAPPPPPPPPQRGRAVLLLAPSPPQRASHRGGPRARLPPRAYNSWRQARYRPVDWVTLTVVFPPKLRCAPTRHRAPSEASMRQLMPG